jgi:drug/metabolite transporter (DMT)-like permease
MWLAFALASALLLAIRRIYEKELTAQFGNFSLSLVLQAATLLPLLVLFFFLPLPRDVFSLPLSFWLPLSIIWIVLYPVQNYFLYRSLREGELSEVTPVSALLPILNLIPSFLVLHEIPSAYGFVGIIATVIATYLLLTDVPEGARLGYNRPVLFMLLTIACTAIGSTLDKVAIEVSTPVFYTFMNALGATVVFSILTYMYDQQKDLVRVKTMFWKLALLGVLLALAFVAFATAFVLGPTSYTLAIRSGGFLIAALWGIFFLRESLSKKKIAALVLFALGTLALALG